ncbi:MAG: hypothetical protein ABW168_05835 [Sedimenticola sp.]
MPTFVETIQQAHQSGDLTNHTTLRKAMMYQNYLDTPLDLKGTLRALSEWPHLDPNEPSPGYRATRAPFFSHFKPGPIFTPNSPLRRVIKAAYVFKDGDFTRTTKRILGDANLPPEQRVRQFESYVLPFWTKPGSGKQRAWLYFSDNPSRPSHLLQDLGLFHYGNVDSRDSIFRFTFEPGECVKPHWGDADLSFYFLQAKENEPHGWTLSLRSGEPTYPEIIHQDTEQLKLTDVILEAVDGHCDLAAPNNSYWKAQRDRIKEARA